MIYDVLKNKKKPNRIAHTGTALNTRWILFFFLLYYLNVNCTSFLRMLKKHFLEMLTVINRHWFWVLSQELNINYKRLNLNRCKKNALMGVRMFYIKSVLYF